MKINTLDCFTYVQLTIAHAALKKLLEKVLNGEQPEYLDAGICLNWAHVLKKDCNYHGDAVDLSHDLSRILSQNWEECSKPGQQTSYPIRSSLAEALWEGSNRATRIRFMQYMLKEIEQYMNTQGRIKPVLKNCLVRFQFEYINAAGKTAKLAGAIPFMAEEDVAPDIGSAIVNALPNATYTYTEFL